MLSNGAEVSLGVVSRREEKSEKLKYEFSKLGAGGGGEAQSPQGMGNAQHYLKGERFLGGACCFIFGFHWGCLNDYRKPHRIKREGGI